MISADGTTEAAPALVHGLLVDVESWPLWSPHVASLRAPSPQVEPGWVGSPRAVFSPIAVDMVVDEVRRDGGYRWHSRLGPWRLDYENLVDAAAGGGSTIAFGARLSGPGSRWIERVVSPLSRRGQRRRIERLSRLAQLVATAERRGDS